MIFKLDTQKMISDPRTNMYPAICSRACVRMYEGVCVYEYMYMNICIYTNTKFHRIFINHVS